MRYPDASRTDVNELMHGRSVADPYRWLEDASDPDTVAWSAAEDALAMPWLAALTGRNALRGRLEDLVPDYRSAPHVFGEQRFWMERRAGQDHAVLFVEDAGGRRPLVDPNAIGPDGTVTLDGWEPSWEDDRLAYLLSEGGDEESVLRVMDVPTGAVIDGPIYRAKYSPIGWMPHGKEYLYVRRLPPGEVPAGEEAFHRRLWRHRVGTDPSEDELVFGDEHLDKTAYLGVTTSPDGRWAAVTVSPGTAPRNDLYVARMNDRLDWIPAMVGVDAVAWPHFDRRGALWVVTNLDAPRRRLCRADPARPEPEHWEEVVAEDPDGGVLEDYALAGDTLPLVHRIHAVARLRIHDRETGSFTKDVALPGPGAADLTGRVDEGAEVWVGYTDDVTPYEAVALAELSSRGVGRSNVDTRQVTYRSADGTEVRMRVIAPVAGPPVPRPTILYGYGGFAVPMTPAYSSSIVAWVEAGGVWAIAQLRGGSEEGEAWHRAGMRQQKTKVYEDFEAAADWLVAEGCTTPDQLGIFGGSNGGLLVGAALTRSPSRYAAVVCSAPLLDMIRYERFGLGTTWSDEFGRAEDPEEFAWLGSYSPYHHVAEGMKYPAVLFTVFESDTRVDPLHARKMAAALQWATASDSDERPVLLRREVDVGHGPRAMRRSLDLAADQLAFFARQLKLPLAP